MRQMPALTDFDNILNVSVLGVRGQAARHIALIDSEPSLNLEKVYHPTLNSEQLPLTNDLDSCMESDAIIIASPTNVHREHIGVLLDYSGYIFLEKPGFGTRADIDWAVDLPDDLKSRIKVNFNLEFNPVANALKSALKDFQIGYPIHATFETNHGGAYKQDWRNSWRTNDPLSGPIYTVGIHYVHWLTLIFGQPVESKVQTRNVSGLSANDSGSAQLIWDNGFTANVTTSYASAFKVKFEITGTDGYLVYDGETLDLNAPRNTYDERGFFASPPKRHVLSAKWNDAYLTSMQKSQIAFWDLVRNKSVLPIAEFDRDVKALSVLIDNDST
jgi:predicted dehydrogenase